MHFRRKSGKLKESEAPTKEGLLRKKRKNTMDNTQISALDKALAAAKARKAAKESEASAELDGTLTMDSTEEATKKVITRTRKDSAAVEAARAAKKAQLAAERAERQAKREQEREAKKVAAAAEKANKPAKSPAHMAKVLRAQEKLPKLSDAATIVFEEARNALSEAELATLAAHLQFFTRIQATERAATATVEAGMRVRITGGDPRFIGLTGTVSKAQRIRCFVELDTIDREAYCFISDVEQLAEETIESSIAAAATESEPEAEAPAVEEENTTEEAPVAEVSEENTEEVEEPAQDSTGTEG